jgi:hypothetical protein
VAGTSPHMRRSWPALAAACGPTMRRRHGAMVPCGVSWSSASYWLDLLAAEAPCSRGHGSRLVLAKMGLDGQQTSGSGEAASGGGHVACRA